MEKRWLSKVLGDQFNNRPGFKGLLSFRIFHKLDNNRNWSSRLFSHISGRLLSSYLASDPLIFLYFASSSMAASPKKIGNVSFSDPSISTPFKTCHKIYSTLSNLSYPAQSPFVVLYRPRHPLQLLFPTRRSCQNLFCLGYFWIRNVKKSRFRRLSNYRRRLRFPTVKAISFFQAMCSFRSRLDHFK